MNSTIIGSMTKIYATNSGGVITQSFPTQRRTFHGALLVRPQDVGKWTEWTTEERDAWQAVAHEVPHLDPAKHWLIDLWNKACDKWGRYNEETGYFELNGLTDITYDQALTIYRTFNGETRPDYSMLNPQPDESRRARTLLPITNWIDPVDVSRIISTNDYIEAIRFEQNRFYPAAITLRVGGSSGFPYCPKLRSILADKGLTIAANAWFDADPLLETVQIRPYRNFSLRFPDSPLLSLESVKYMVNHPVEVTAVTIIVHPEVFAKLTDEENEEWHALLEQAAAKNITFAEA